MNITDGRHLQLQQYPFHQRRLVSVEMEQFLVSVKCDPARMPRQDQCEPAVQFDSLSVCSVRDGHQDQECIQLDMIDIQNAHAHVKTLDI